jgi:hypothetical protein
MSDEHFTVDGTLIQAWASQKSFRSKDGSDDSNGANFHGQKRSNKTHESTTDADARLYKKSYGKESKLSYLGHALVENRNGLIVAAMATHADGSKRAAHAASRWAPTRLTTLRISSARCGSLKHLQQKGPQNVLRGNRRAARLSIQRIELRTQRHQHRIRQLANRPQWMILRHTLLQRHIAEHPVLNPLVSTHTR